MSQEKKEQSDQKRKQKKLLIPLVEGSSGANSETPTTPPAPVQPPASPQPQTPENTTPKDNEKTPKAEAGGKDKAKDKKKKKNKPENKAEKDPSLDVDPKKLRDKLETTLVEIDEKYNLILDGLVSERDILKTQEIVPSFCDSWCEKNWTYFKYKGENHLIYKWFPLQKSDITAEIARLEKEIAELKKAEQPASSEGDVDKDPEPATPESIEKTAKRVFERLNTQLSPFMDPNFIENISSKKWHKLGKKYVFNGEEFTFKETPLGQNRMLFDKNGLARFKQTETETHFYNKYDEEVFYVSSKNVLTVFDPKTKNKLFEWNLDTKKVSIFNPSSDGELIYEIDSNGISTSSSRVDSSALESYLKDIADNYVQPFTSK